MSGLDGLRLDADGYVDMDQFPDDGSDLAGIDLDQLRETLHADPVEEPTAEQWDAMFDDVVGVGDTGPFALDDTGLDAGLDLAGVDGSPVAPHDAFDADDPATVDPSDDRVDAADASDGDLDEGLDLDGDLAFDDAVLDDGAFDNAAFDDAVLDDGADDVFTAEGLDDAPTDVPHDGGDLL